MKKSNVKKKTNKKNKLEIFNSDILIIILLVIFFVFLLLVLNTLINFNKLNKKINTIVNLKEDIVLLGATYSNVEQLNIDVNKLIDNNNGYNNQIINIKKDIEKINNNISELKSSK